MKGVLLEMICPLCGGRETGKVGVDQFFCGQCCIEFRRQGSNVTVFDVLEDGTLMPWEEQLAAPYL